MFVRKIKFQYPLKKHKKFRGSIKKWNDSKMSYEFKFFKPNETGFRIDCFFLKYHWENCFEEILMHCKWKIRSTLQQGLKLINVDGTVCRI